MPNVTNRTAWIIGGSIVVAALIVVVGVNAEADPCSAWQEKAEELVNEWNDSLMIPGDPSTELLMEDLVRHDDDRPAGCDKSDEFDGRAGIARTMLILPNPP
jgi:hypothetical protein